MGLVCTTDEFLMIRKTFHPITTEKNEWFRIRQESDKITMTYKCIHNDSIDGVEEYEIIVDDFDAAAKILEKTGLKKLLHKKIIEKYGKITKLKFVSILGQDWRHISKSRGKMKKLLRNMSKKCDTLFLMDCSADQKWFMKKSYELTQKFSFLSQKLPLKILRK